MIFRECILNRLYGFDYRKKCQRKVKYASVCHKMCVANHFQWTWLLFSMTIWITLYYPHKLLAERHFSNIIFIQMPSKLNASLEKCVRTSFWNLDDDYSLDYKTDGNHNSRDSNLVRFSMHYYLEHYLLVISFRIWIAYTCAAFACMFTAFSLQFKFERFTKTFKAITRQKHRIRKRNEENKNEPYQLFENHLGLNYRLILMEPACYEGKKKFNSQSKW